MGVRQPPTIGERFGRWEVVGESFFASPGHRVVPCRCACGAERSVLVFQLRRGRSSSCGCLKREQVATLVSRTRWKDSHGLGHHPLYGTWKAMRRRCHDPGADNYDRYGGRGIEVYEPWFTDPGAFIDYVEAELGPRPEGTTLDRIDNDGDYRPGNLRWATPAQQIANRSRV